jgi:hypothetical protein
MRKPRTRAERDEAKYKARELFFRRATRLKSWDEAWDFAYRGPQAIHEGGPLYTNLVYFMRGGTPFGADDEQVSLYNELVKRLGPLAPRGF